MANPSPTEKLVYLALREVFNGSETLPSTTKKIRKKIRQKIGEDVKISSLIQQFGLESVTEVAIVLLQEQIFGSDLRAKERFPDISDVLPSQDNQPIDSEPKIAEGDTAAIQCIGAYSPDEMLSIGARLKIRKEREAQIKANLPVDIAKVTTSKIVAPNIVKGKGFETVEADPQSIPAVSEAPQQLSTKPEKATQSLDSIFLPLWDQHRVLVRIQYALEKACFTFAQKHLGVVLQTEGWDCAEAVELNRWPKILLTYQENSNLNSVQEAEKPLHSLLDSITQLRHDTVHRARLSSSRILQYLTDAGHLARLLHDDGCNELMSTIRFRTQGAIEELVRNKALLDRKLTEIKEEFAAKRAELERQESALLEAAVREHEEPVVSVSRSLDRLSDGPCGPDENLAGRRHVYGSAPPIDESFGSEDTAETKVGRELGDGVVEGIDEDVEMVNQLPVLPLLAPSVDSGMVEPVIAREQKEAGREKYEVVLEEEPCLERPEVLFDGHDPSKPQPLHQQNVENVILNAVEQSDKQPETAAVVSKPDDSDIREYDKRPLCEPSTTPVSTCARETGIEDVSALHKSPIRQAVTFDNSYFDFDTRIKRSDYELFLNAVRQVVAEMSGVEAIAPLLEKVKPVT